MKTPTEIGYSFARKELTNQFLVDPSPFLGTDGFISPTLIGEWLMNERNADEEDAFEWAILWMDEPSVKSFVDPIMR